MTTAPTPEEVRELAAELDTYTAFDPGDWPCHKAADMLRGLQADNDLLRGDYALRGAQIQRMAALIDELEARKPLPLSDERIDDLHGEANRGFDIGHEEYFKAFRDAERAHGIKET